MAQNELMKGLKAHCAVMQKSHDAMAECHQALSEAFKAEQAEGLHKGFKDHHADIVACNKSMSESWGRLAEKCTKSDDAEFVKVIVSSVMGAVDQKYGSMIVPDGVRKTFTTEDPFAPAPGLTLMPRSGGPTPPTNTERIDPALRQLVQE
jgi:hypothetical protein